MARPKLSNQPLEEIFMERRERYIKCADYIFTVPSKGDIASSVSPLE